ncbi:mechanosensitive ion channel family protein [Novipirellula rosea]|uniref:mechanosensitive ion channel family protein n=1 Tax=Novipirellula rosea TaxID=1031540 RepID=UPI0031EFBFDF
MQTHHVPSRLIRDFALLLGFVIVFASRTFAQDASLVDADDKAESQPTVEVENVVEDSAIASRLRRIFESSGWYSDLEIDSDNGIVTVSGMADTEEHREWAGSTARRTQDVIAVINKLDVNSAVELSSSKQVIGESLNELWRDLLVRSPLLIAAAIVLVVTALLAKFVGWSIVRILTNRKLRTSLKDLVYQLVSIAVWIVGVLTATVVAFPGMTPSKALTVLGLGSVAVGFAFKDIFENFFAGILILWRYPFDRGDFITCEDLTGRVEKITIRNTLIRRLDGELAVVPNANLFKSTVDVLTNQPQRRVRIICGVAYDEDVDKSREVIRKAVQGCESVEGVRTVEIFAQDFASSSINFEVAWWTGSKPLDIRRSRDEVIAAIKRELDDAKIEIPFPYRTLVFKDPEARIRLEEQSSAQEATGQRP